MSFGEDWGELVVGAEFTPVDRLTDTLVGWM